VWLKGALLGAFAASKLLQRKMVKTTGKVKKATPCPCWLSRTPLATQVNKCMALKAFIYKFAFTTAV